jgi:hypothetical protein
MKSIVNFLTMHLFVNFIITKILDILIYKILSVQIDNVINLNYFTYSKDLIISFVVLLISFFLYN